MRTNHVEYLLPDYVAGKLEDTLRPGVEVHLRHCASCRNVAEELASTLTTVGQSKPPAVEEQFLTTILPRVRQRLETGKTSQWWRSPAFARLVMPLGAALVVSAVLLNLVLLPSREGTEHSAQLSGTSEELAAMVEDRLLSDPLGAFVIRETLGLFSLTDGRLYEDLGEVFSAEMSPWDELVAASGFSLLNGLSAQDLDALVRRLGERNAL